MIQDTQVIVKVKDTGTGIDPEILPQLFSTFGSKSFESTGLGLFIAKIVEAHYGKIWAENINFNTHRQKTPTNNITQPTNKTQPNLNDNQQ